MGLSIDRETPTFRGQDTLCRKGRKTWSDGRYQRLENFLESFVLGLRVAAATAKKNRLEREGEERPREKERKREEKEEKVASEQERKADFIAFRPLAFARSSWPCACSRWLLPCCHPTPLAPASSSPPATRSAAPGQTTLAAPTDAACENPRWFGNPVHCPPPASGSPHLPLTFSGSAARKILPRSSRRAKSWSSCADGREADLAPLFHRP